MTAYEQHVRALAAIADAMERASKEDRTGDLARLGIEYRKLMHEVRAESESARMISRTVREPIKTKP